MTSQNDMDFNDAFTSNDEQFQQKYESYPTSTSKTGGGGSGGGGMFGEGYAQAGAATFDTAVNWIMFGQERKQIEKWREEDLALARQAQQLALRQQAFQNQLSREEMELAREGFDFGKMRWGEEFALTKKEQQQAMKLRREQERRASEAWGIEKNRSALNSLKNSLNSVLGNDIQMKQLVAQRMGA